MEDRHSRPSDLESLACLGGLVWAVAGVGAAFLILHLLEDELFRALLDVLTPLALLAAR